jgi:hypothetical protein
MLYGSFSGNPKTEWLCDDVDDGNMRLLEAFWYIDPQGRRWDAPKGGITNGASIPRTLWSSIGSPYTGKYRRAAIVHDFAVQTPGVLRDDADTMFYFACAAGGCPLMDSKLLYAGVRIGTWGLATRDYAVNIFTFAPMAPRLPGQQTPTELEMRARYTLLAAELQDTGDDFDAIHAAVARQLALPGRA